MSMGDGGSWRVAVGGLHWAGGAEVTEGRGWRLTNEEPYTPHFPQPHRASCISVIEKLSYPPVSIPRSALTSSILVPLL